MPHYFSARDEPWLRALIEEYSRFVARKQSELHERLREPLPTRAPKSKLKIACHVLDALSRDRTRSAIPPKEARAALFRAAASSALPRDALLESAAASFGVGAVELEAALFADLHGERRVAELPSALSPSRLVTDSNLALVRGLLRRAVQVRIAAWGNTRALVRHARLVGLICTLSSVAARALKEDTQGVVLDVSGPFALFRHTEVYGRALASLVPRVAWCHEYELTASCALGRGGALSSFVLRSGDPIAPGRELARHDSRLEQRFDRDFRRAAPDWELIREPRPVAAGGTLIFPDFELVHRRDPSRRWLLEIVGFWTQKYLTEKLERLRAAGIDQLLLCVDQKRHCTAEDFPPHARVIRYKSRIDPRAVLALVEPR